MGVRAPSIDPDRLAASIAEANVRWEIGIHRLMAAATIAAAFVVVAISPAIGRELALAELALCVVTIAHFMMSSIVLRRMRGPWLQPIRWYSATVEATLSSVAIGFCVVFQSAEWAATSPTLSIYTVAIVACSVRMQPRLTAYLTALTIVQWIALYYGFIYPSLSTTALATANAWAMWERVFWLALIGGAATFTTLQVRNSAMTGGSHAQRRQWLMQEFSKLVSADAAEVVLSGAAKRGPLERRELTVLFCDLRDFTGMCERESPRQVSRLLNDFYERACAVVRGHGGQINKFLGDGLLVLFDPKNLPGNHAVVAIDAAVALAGEAETLRERDGIWAHLRVGIGIDTGPVMIGMLGSEERLEFTAIGSTVNRAARLQAVARSGDMGVVVSGATAAAARAACDFTSLGEVVVKGFAKPIEIYEPKLRAAA
jgi:class 3 adenylate cyclase